MGARRNGAWAIALVALVALVSLACEPPPDAIHGPPRDCPDATFDQDIAVSAIDTTVLAGTRANVHTAAGTKYVTVDLQDNQGTISFLGQGPFPAFVHSRIPWPDIGYTLLQGLAVDDGAWIPFWLYCAPDGTLGSFYAERTDQIAPYSEGVEGTCDEAAEIWNMPVALPANTLRNVVLTCGFTVSTPASDPPLRLEGSKPGVAAIDSEGPPATVLVFSAVDCRQDCGTPGWFELHSLVWQPQTAQVGFAIWYLDGGNSGTGASASDFLMLPAGYWMQARSPTASWALHF